MCENRKWRSRNFSSKFSYNKILSRIQKKQSRKIVIPENGQNNKQQQNKMKNEKQINFKFVNK